MAHRPVTRKRHDTRMTCRMNHEQLAELARPVPDSRVARNGSSDRHLLARAVHESKPLPNVSSDQATREVAWQISTMFVNGRTTSWPDNQGASISSSSCIRPGSTTGARSRPGREAWQAGRAANGLSWTPPSRRWRRSRAITPILGRRSSPCCASGSPPMMPARRGPTGATDLERAAHARAYRERPSEWDPARRDGRRRGGRRYAARLGGRRDGAGPIARSCSSRPSRPRAGRRSPTRSAGSAARRTSSSTSPSSSGRSRTPFAPRPSIPRSPRWWCRRAFPSGRALMPRF